MRSKKHTVKHSIKREIAFSFGILMIGTLVVCWLLNSTFLESYYLQNRQKDLVSGYNLMAGALLGENFNQDSFLQQMQGLSDKSTISGIVLDPDSNMVFYFGGDSKSLERRIRDYLFSLQSGSMEVLEENDYYILIKTIDKDTRFEYLEMHGVVGAGTVFMLRTPLSNIKESVDLANRFLLYTGIGAILISGLIIWLISKKITEPILQLADISEQMADLNFEAKYQGKDDTEIALLGANINQLSETLEKTISELKTANNELQKDIEKKDAIDEMRKEFLSNVSHELKTPIALIQGYAEGLAEGIDENVESRTFYCDVIIDEAAKMNTMVKKLLTLNQLECGNDMVAMERFDIVLLICNYIQSAQILTEQNEISVRMEHYDPIYVWADEFKTEEVFMNYFSNAVNHAAGEKIIDVKLTQIDGKVRVTVFNTGEPIPEESLPHLWEKFYKVDKARTREYGGSGVGLSIVKAIMDSMHQQYGVQNYENGVAFWFELEKGNL